MNPRTLIDRLLSPAGFGLVLLLFLLPFATVSCGTKQGDPPVEATFTFTGVDLLIGGSPTIGDNGAAATGADTVPIDEADQADAESDFDAQFGKYYPAQPLALLAAVIIFAGMILALITSGVLGSGSTSPRLRSYGALINAVAAAVAAVLLIVEVLVIAPSSASTAIGEVLAEQPAEVSNALQYGTSPAYGFWIVIVLLIGLAAWQGYLTVRRPALAPPPGAEPPSEPPGTGQPGVPPPGGPVPGAPQSGGMPL